MVSKTFSVASSDTSEMLINIETDISKGLPYFNIVGFADTSVKEASERVKRAVINSGFLFPRGRVSVNLSPACIHKRGSHFDLAIAVGILSAAGEIKGMTEDSAFIGELSFEGKVISSGKSALMLSPDLKEKGIKKIYVPSADYIEAELFTLGSGIRIIPVDSIRETVRYIEGANPEKGVNLNEIKIEEISSEDFSDVKGHEEVKEAIMIAVAGFHSLLMIGPPGTGKTMMARRIRGILPPMTLEEICQTTQIYSYAGKLDESTPIIGIRPFRQVNSRITPAALIGGGKTPVPGEISLAHNGILFMDEMLETDPKVTDLLRGPLQDREVKIVRKSLSVTFPSKFLLIGASNPCRCGFLGDRTKRCTCTVSEIHRYRSRLSGPVSDRMDICIETGRIDYKTLKTKKGMSSSYMRQQIERVRAVQKSRGCISGMMSDRQTEELCILTKDGEDLIKKMYSSMDVSPRRYYKILRVARTIADFRESRLIDGEHIAAAFHYTRFFEERGEE